MVLRKCLCAKHGLRKVVLPPHGRSQLFVSLGLRQQLHLNNKGHFYEVRGSEMLTDRQSVTFVHIVTKQRQ